MVGHTTGVKAMQKLIFAVLSAWPCWAQQALLLNKGVISGTVTGDDHVAIKGAQVGLFATQPGARTSTTGRQRYTTSGAGGTFQFTGLDGGSYRLCAQAPEGHWINPCEWGGQQSTTALSFSQPTVAVTLTLSSRLLKKAPRGIRHPSRFFFQKPSGASHNGPA